MNYIQNTKTHKMSAERRGRPECDGSSAFYSCNIAAATRIPSPRRLDAIDLRVVS
jgi:hypothetical protein